jgi:membrane-bound metal-dependent hydrolase YbcI (DUF457 family)
MLIAAIAANAPDLDFLVGLMAGSINAYHPNPSHSILGALIFALAAAVSFGPSLADRCRLLGFVVLLYGSHVLLDMLCEPFTAWTGLQLFWPLSDEGYLFPWQPLLGIRHGASSDGVGRFLEALFSSHNLRAVALEVVVFLPLAWLRLRRVADFNGLVTPRRSGEEANRTLASRLVAQKTASKR